MTRSHRLAAVWFADIAGYSELSERDHSAALRVLAELERIAQSECQAREGRVVKTTVDEVLAVFDSVDQAVHAAIATRDRFLASPEVHRGRVSLRIGVHVGEVADAADGGVHGDAVDVAARIEPLAPLGQVVASETAYRLVRQRSAVEADDLGEHDLTGVEEPVRVFGLSLNRLSTDTEMHEHLRLALAPMQILDARMAGGMGDIFLARDPHLRRTLAVKVLRQELLGDRQTRERFLREAQVIAGLSHPNVISVHSVGELPDGTPYFVMDYIEGGSLADRIEAEGPLTLPEATRTIGEVASALEAAHERGVAHRDIKASNVLFDVESGRSLVSDWGIAGLDPLADLAPEARITEAGVVIGSPQYMSPEQLAGDETGPASDMYQLGLLFFELLTGEGPFHVETPRQIMLAHLRDDAPALSTVYPGVTPDVDAVVSRCLSKNPSERPTSKEVARRFAPGAAAVLEWPPPGLSDLSKQTRTTLGMLGVTLGALITGVLFTGLAAGGTDSNTDSLTALAVGCILVALICAGASSWYLVGLARAVRRGAQLGYPLSILLDAMADKRGDTGDLLVARREFASLSASRRRHVLWVRRIKLIGNAAAIGFLLPALLGRPLLAIVGVACFLIADALGDLEHWWLRKPRQLYKKIQQRPADMAALVSPWREAFAAVTSRSVPPGLSRRSVGAIGLAGPAIAGLIVLVIVLFLPLTVTAGWGGVFALWATPRVSATQERMVRARAFEDFRLADDGTVTADEASTLLARMIGGPGGAGRGTDDPLHDWVRPDSAEFARLLPQVEVYVDSLFPLADRGFSDEQAAMILQTTTQPVFDAWTRVARAPAADVAYATIALWGAQDSVTFWNRSFPRYSVLLEPARWKIYRAAYEYSIGNLAAAELHLREVVSVGLLLTEQTLVIENLVGVVVLGIGGEFLLQLYERTDRTQQAAAIRRLQADSTGVPAMAPPDLLESASVSAGAGQAVLREYVLNRDLARGLRFEMLALLNVVAPCSGGVRILWGPSEASSEAIRQGEAELLDTAGARALYESARDWPNRIELSGLDGWRWWAHKSAVASSLAFGNPRIRHCAALALRTQELF